MLLPIIPAFGSGDLCRLEQFQGDWNVARLMGFAPLNPSYRIVWRLMRRMG